MKRSETVVVHSEVLRRGRLWLAEARQTLGLAFPIVAGFVGQMLMGIADTVMIGQVGTIPLAAAAFGHNLLNVPMVAGYGLISAVGVMTAQAYGAQRYRAAGEALRHGLMLSLVCGTATGLAFWMGRSHLAWLRQPPEVLAEAQVYLLLVGWSMLPTLFSHSLKQFSEALTRVWPPMYILLGGVLLNILLNWMWIFGHLGFSAMGLAGAGWATLVARVVTAFGMAVYVIRENDLRSWLPSRWWGRAQRAVLGELLRLGVPVAAQHLLEVGAFVAAALMMGWIGPTAMAGHQIAITCAATSFMVSLGIGMAVSIRVGHAWGARAQERVRRVGFTGLAMTVGIMASFGVLFFFGGNELAQWFTPSSEVVVVAGGMLTVAAFFQVFDGLQAVALCALRGMSDVRAPAIIAVVAYWLVALPLGYVLCFALERGPKGMWVGLAAGLGVAAAVLIWRFHELAVNRSGLTNQEGSV
jgi:MATE family multidrug resistance protein